MCTQYPQRYSSLIVEIIISSNGYPIFLLRLISDIYGYLILEKELISDNPISVYMYIYQFSCTSRIMYITLAMIKSIRNNT